jgi:hypothetical protein
MIHPFSLYPHPGKYEGEIMLTVLADRYKNEGMESESFGDVDIYGYFFSIEFPGKYGTRYYCMDSNGFVSEVSKNYFVSYGQEYANLSDRDDMIRDVYREIEALEEEEESGRCDSCEVANINGVRSHEHGCPRYAKLKALRKQLEELEDSL